MNVKHYDGDDRAFKDACSKARIPATARQYRKWRQNRGAARKASKHKVA